MVEVGGRGGTVEEGRSSLRQKMWGNNGGDKRQATTVRWGRREGGGEHAGGAPDFPIGRRGDTCPQGATEIHPRRPPRLAPALTHHGPLVHRSVVWVLSL